MLNGWVKKGTFQQEVSGGQLKEAYHTDTFMKFLRNCISGSHIKAFLSP